MIVYVIIISIEDRDEYTCDRTIGVSFTLDGAKKLITADVEKFGNSSKSVFMPQNLGYTVEQRQLENTDVDNYYFFDDCGKEVV